MLQYVIIQRNEKIVLKYVLDVVSNGLDTVETFNEISTCVIQKVPCGTPNFAPSFTKNQFIYETRRLVYENKDVI